MTEASTSLRPEETTLVGRWVRVGDATKPDAVADRIKTLVRDSLVRVGSDTTGWDTLYRDPLDGRFWELVYPQSELHGGGPPSLVFISSQMAAQKYGAAVLSSNTSFERTREG